MKKLLIAGAFALAATGASAGGLDDPIVTPTVTPTEIVDAAVDSSGDGWVFVLMTFLTMIVVGTN